MNRSAAEALALALGKRSEEILRVLYFGAEIVLPTAGWGPFRPYDVVSADEGDDYREKYGEDYESASGYDGIREALERTDFSALIQPERLGQLLGIHPRLLGQLLCPDVYVAVEPETLAGSLIPGEVYKLVCHRIKAVSGQELLRRALIDRLSRLKAEDDAACRQENGCDRVDLAMLGWEREEPARPDVPVEQEEEWEMPPAMEFWPDEDSPEEEWEESI